MNQSSIEWTQWTSNPIQAYADGKRGWFCEKVSPGCAHCYSSTQNEVARWGGNGLAFLAANRERVEFRLNEAELKEWSAVNSRSKQPKYSGRCFAFDMTDLFGEWVSDEWLFMIFEAMSDAPNLDFQILTKRPQRAHDFITAQVGNGWPLPNVWLGVTVENQRWADHRIPILLETPAAVRFVSAEPLLEPVDFIDPMHEYDNKYHGGEWDWLGHEYQPGRAMKTPLRTEHPCKLCGNFEPNLMHRHIIKKYPEHYDSVLDWIIVGGESGPKHRAFDPAWARSVVTQCSEAGVACFVKQLGGARPGNRLEDLPEDLRVRQFPR